MAQILAAVGGGCLFNGCASVSDLVARLRAGAQSAGSALPDDGVAGATRTVLHQAFSAYGPGGGLGRVLIVLIAPPTDETTASDTLSDDALVGLGVDAARAAGEAAEEIQRPERAPDLPSGLSAAEAALTSGRSDTVVIVGVSQSGSALDGAEAPFSLAFDKAGVAPPVSEGAAAIALRRVEEAAPRYARLTPISRTEETGARGVEAAFQGLLSAESWRPSQVGLLAISGRRRAAVAEATAIARLYREGPRETALYAALASLGDAGPASDVASLLVAAQCVERALLPQTPNWSGPGPVALKEAEGLYVTEEARIWLGREDAPRRIAAVACQGADGRSAFIGVEAGSISAPIAATALSPGRPLLFPLAASNRDGLRAGLAALTESAAGADDLVGLAKQCMVRADQASSSPERMAIVASSAKELAREIGFMTKGLAKAEQSDKAIRTPGGSVYAPKPIARGGGKIAFVTPGIGSAYVGLGKEILLSFALQCTGIEERLKLRLPTFLRTDLIYPRAFERFTDAEHEAFTEALNGDGSSLPLVSIAFGVIHSVLLRAVFGVQPDIAMGYSVGEMGMRIGLGQWTDWGAMEKQLAHPCLTSGLLGELTAAQDYWRQKNGAVSADDGAQWANYVLKADADAVRAAVDKVDDVYFTVVNTPDETVIAGHPKACVQVMNDMQALGMPLEMRIAIHAPPARLVLSDIEEICDNPCNPVDGVEFYSAKLNAPTSNDRAQIAKTTAEMLVDPLDFRRLVETVYDDGARIFVETGVRNNCTNWIAATLGDRPHLAVAMDVKGVASDLSLMRAIAQLFAHQAPVRFNELVDETSNATADAVRQLLERVEA